MHQIKLSELKIGEFAKICAFSTEEIPTKIYNMGLVPGANIQLFKKAPFNGPICICLGGKQCKIALRKEDANFILVEKN